MDHLTPAQQSAINANNISKIQQDISIVNVLVEKVEITLERLTDVSARVSEILAVQGIRLDSQEKVSIQMQELMEKRRQETETNIKEIHQKIETIRVGLDNELKRTQKRLLEEIKDVQTQLTAEHAASKSEFKSVEKWVWSAIGGLAAILFVIEMLLK